MITWIIESNVFEDNDSRLVEAAKVGGHEIIRWQDEWLLRGKFPVPIHRFAIFHGSLGNASQIAAKTLWKPGAFCTTENYACSFWYSKCKEWLLHEKWVHTTVSKFVSNPKFIFEQLGTSYSVFVRPDSPLKPFSGRVLKEENVSLKALDFGYYYADQDLPIIVAPVHHITTEWRFVVIKGQIIAGSEYLAENRAKSVCITSGRAWEYAQMIANHTSQPDHAYILDLCESEGEIKMLEINPFSGADFYACDRSAIVKSMAFLADHFV